MEIAKIVRVLAEWARTKQLILRVYVFGSRARGTQRDNGDLDLAVELDPRSFPGADDSGGFATWMFETKGWKEELESLIPLKIQLEYYHGDETPTVHAGVQESSILAYEKVP